MHILRPWHRILTSGRELWNGRGPCESASPLPLLDPPMSAGLAEAAARCVSCVQVLVPGQQKQEMRSDTDSHSVYKTFLLLIPVFGKFQCAIYFILLKSSSSISGIFFFFYK